MWLLSWPMLLAIVLLWGNLGALLLTPYIVEWSLRKLINLKEDGFVFPIYKEPPIVTQTEFRLFQITNPREVLKGAKMNLNVKGPYLYSGRVYRDEVAFKEAGESVQFNSHRKLQVKPEQVLDLDEKFWMLNPILPTTAKMVRSIVLDRLPFQSVSEPIVFNGVNVALDTFGERLMFKLSPREILDGRKVTLLEIVEMAATRFGLKALLPPAPPENTFGLAHAQNNTVDNMEIYTGLGKTSDRFAEVRLWKGKDRIPFWTGKCSIINGTNGELYKPLLVEGRALQVFFWPLCRTFHMDPVEPNRVRLPNGLDALEYEISQRLFLGAKSNPRNKCYCLDKRTYDCQFDGLLSMGPCFFDAPLFFARPNLRGLDRRIRGTIGALTQESEMPEKQSFYLEPNTGSIVKANFTLVGLFKVIKQPYMRDLANVQDLSYVPLFAASEVIEAPPSLTWQLSALQLFQRYRVPINLLGAALGFALGAGRIIYQLGKPSSDLQPQNH